MRHDGGCDRNRWAIRLPRCTGPGLWYSPGACELTWCDQHRHSGDERVSLLYSLAFRLRNWAGLSK